jgi:hypothetical protein
MARSTKYATTDEVVRKLSLKRDVKITPAGEVLVIHPNSPKRVGDVGNKSWGKIDFLVRACKYRFTYVNSF